ncbi:NADH dehydrogenase subunit 3 (mitochondrion) [Drosophila tropicalis]|uniref:NADH-ubiquinone oxidoreductase chain 3 n=1 Tax=Drosophila willistoni TaxID=7260 RepID=A0A8F4YPC6_DROWI|nr:NADH dehydrogenase subunit 3 [Drosophila willistoni]YP_010691283.1 NADH dehydrogenase subunit 3 [Drosophila insularis]YP_010691348.1 NADH dehydrogenase subunit 3 [Drosophila tropicalis]WBU93816.1 NADH dehydrogenase subunit 3 [Drosophila paulistorum]QXG19600.1 NADH dehydrogenase subunit 3 [Drosophila willistoni]WBU93803.1 NADH dehydrogenase subunit 3 [Drosophila willistoni]WBU93868.1 NADH dehydrogenase subunit 3 [Drosophila willistoni]WBU93907.1 NADH dehydrogenase subunit 3 [Drosophila ins
MFSIIFIGSVIFIISMVVMLLASILSKKTLVDREKSSPFECGFDPKSSSRLPFSLRFFLITIIFLIFDVEIALILPMIIILKFSNLLIWSITSIIFILILLIGLYHEWNQGMLNWSN